MHDKEIMEAEKHEVIRCFGSAAGNICEAIDALADAFKRTEETLEEFAKSLQFEAIKAKRGTLPRPSYKAPRINFLFLDKRPRVYKCRSRC